MRRNSKQLFPYKSEIKKLEGEVTPHSFFADNAQEKH